MRNRIAIVSVLGLALLLAFFSIGYGPIVQAQSCTSPGNGNSTDFPYDSAANTYVVCNLLSAQATINAYTPTPYPTLQPTPAVIATQTGCDPHGNSNLYQSCVIADSSARGSINNLIFLPAIFFAILIVALLRWAH